MEENDETVLPAVGDLIVQTNNHEGTPVVNSVVRISNGQLSACKRTDSRGIASFLNIPIGSYSINAYLTVLKLYKIKDNVMVFIGTSRHEPINFGNLSSYPTGGYIRFIVVDTLNYNQPIQDIVIREVDDNDGFIQQVTTNSLGYAEFYYANLASAVGIHYFVINNDPRIEVTLTVNDKDVTVQYH